MENNRLLRGIGRVLFWRYRRGSWQYDIVCGLILVFIFLTPKAVFDGSYFKQMDSQQRGESTELSESRPAFSAEADLKGKDEVDPRSKKSPQ